MKTIYAILTPTSANISEWDYIVETNLNVLGRSENIECLFSRERQNKDWFFSKEEAESQIERNKEMYRKIEALKLGII